MAQSDNAGIVPPKQMTKKFPESVEWVMTMLSMEDNQVPKSPADMLLILKYRWGQFYDQKVAYYRNHDASTFLAKLRRCGEAHVKALQKMMDADDHEERVMAESTMIKCRTTANKLMSQIELNEKEHVQQGRELFNTYRFDEPIQRLAISLPVGVGEAPIPRADAPGMQAHRAPQSNHHDGMPGHRPSEVATVDHPEPSVVACPSGPVVTHDQRKPSLAAMQPSMETMEDDDDDLGDMGHDHDPDASSRPNLEHHDHVHRHRADMHADGVQSPSNSPLPSPSGTPRMVTPVLSRSPSQDAILDAWNPNLAAANDDDEPDDHAMLMLKRKQWQTLINAERDLVARDYTNHYDDWITTRRPLDHVRRKCILADQCLKFHHQWPVAIMTPRDKADQIWFYTYAIHRILAKIYHIELRTVACAWYSLQQIFQLSMLDMALPDQASITQPILTTQSRMRHATSPMMDDRSRQDDDDDDDDDVDEEEEEDHAVEDHESSDDASQPQDDQGSSSDDEASEAQPPPNKMIKTA